MRGDFERCLSIARSKLADIMDTLVDMRDIEALISSRGERGSTFERYTFQRDFTVAELRTRVKALNLEFVARENKGKKLHAGSYEDIPEVKFNDVLLKWDVDVDPVAPWVSQCSEVPSHSSEMNFGVGDKLVLGLSTHQLKR